MATKSRSKSGSKSRAKSRARSRSAARKSRARAAERTPVRRHLSPWVRDASGIGLVVLALLSILALWFRAAGPAGEAISWVIHGFMGVAAIAFPIGGAFWGLMLLRGVAEEGSRVRMFIGFCLAFVAILGIVSLAQENPAPLAGVQGAKDWTGVGRAGGVLGALAAWPLSQVISPLGAGIVCAGTAVLGSLIFAGTSFAKVWAWARGISRSDPDDGASEEEANERASRFLGLPAGGARRVVRTEDEDPVVLPEAAGEQEARPGIVLPTDPLVEAGIHLDAAGAAAPAGSTGKEGMSSVGTSIPHASAPRAGASYKSPPLDLLRRAPSSDADGLDEEHTMEALERTFRTFGVAARVPMAHRGPTVTLYEVEVEAGTKVQKVVSLADDISYALATPDVRIIAPIPGKSAVGVEVPNKVRDFVMLGDVLRSKAAREDRHPLSVALGKDVHGKAQMVNLARMPHLLIAGATGAGKSSLINSFVTTVLMRTNPDEVKLVLVDPKRVELSHFADLPHLLSPVIVHPKRAAEALGWVVREMENRYELLATCGVRDIDGYREGLRRGTLRIAPGLEGTFVQFPYLVVVIDELADLMMVAPRDVEDAICRIAQMSRAVGIHLVVATQRPSVDIVTGLIKANIPSRIALMTSSQADSRVILDMNGAEKLVGHGDMLFAPANASKPTRLQAAWVTESEIHEVSEWIRGQREVAYEATIEGLGRPSLESEEAPEAGSDDDLLTQAAELVIRSQLGSTSMLQRKLKVGFARAGRLMDLLEERGIVGPSLGSKARDVLLTWEEWEESRSPSRSG